MTSPGRMTFDLSDVRLEALTWGKPGSPLALCLHGFPDTAWTWRHLGPALAEAGHHVVAPFSRGYAPSSVPTTGDLSTGARIADALDIIEQMGATRTAVIGHDWGAFTVHGLAAMADSPVDDYVSLAVPAFAALSVGRRDIPGYLLQTAAQSRNSWYVLANQIPRLPERHFDRLVRVLWRRWSPGYDATEDLDRLNDAVPTASHRRAVIDYYRQVIRGRETDDRRRELSDLFTTAPRRPILQLYGADDGCLRPQLFEYFRDLPDGSRMIESADAGHFLHLERPEFVNNAITDWLAGAAR